MDRTRRFRIAAAKENRGRQRLGWRYSAKLKALGVEHCQSQRQQGCSYAEIAEQLGISTLTLSRWLDAEPQPSAAFRAVEVVPESEPSANDETQSLCVVTPGGLRIEGLAWSQVLDLARALG